MALMRTRACVQVLGGILGGVWSYLSGEDALPPPGEPPSQAPQAPQHSTPAAAPAPRPE